MNLLREREKTHGDYSLVASVAQALKSALRIGPFDELPGVMRESLEMKCVKWARIVCGDHYERDHWIDDIGYSELVLNHIKEVPGSEPQQETPDEEEYSEGYCPECRTYWARRDISKRWQSTPPDVCRFCGCRGDYHRPTCPSR